MSAQIMFQTCTLPPLNSPLGQHATLSLNGRNSTQFCLLVAMKAGYNALPQTFPSLQQPSSLLCKFSCKGWQASQAYPSLQQSSSLLCKFNCKGWQDRHDA